MNLTRLIADLHQTKQLQQRLKTELLECKERQSELESQIKSVLDKDQIEYENLSEEEFQLMLSDMQSPELINIEVVYADPEQQVIRAVQIPPGSNIEECIALSDITQQCGINNIADHKVGIYGVIKSLDTSVQDGDRVEIYRPVESKTSTQPASTA